MSYGTRIAAVLLGLGFGFAHTGVALADTTTGTYTYQIDISPTASFTITQSGPLGDPGTSSLGWSYNGTPTPGYVPPSDAVFSTVGDNSTWTELQIEWLLPASPGSNSASSIESFTFTAPDTFWAETGVNSFPADGSTTYYALLYSDENVDGSDNGPNPDHFDYINQGAYYGFYTPEGASDPQCTTCSVTTTFTPTVGGAVPEPSTMTLLGTGMVAIVGVFRRRRLS
jgi:hypothetical protein